MLRAIGSSPINVLLLVAPVSWVLAVTSPGSPWVFITAAASLVPLAGLIGLGTEQLARRAGPAWGGFLNATFGNAAEHYSAVTAARRDEMTLAVEISVGSSAQIALFVAPALVLYSFAIGRPMSLLFNAFEIAAIALSVLATQIVVSDGESNWVEGLQLLSVYLILALAFYFVPQGG